MNPQDLLNNPQLQNISPEKLQLLMNLAQNTSPSGSNPKDMAASLKSASNRASKEGMEFSSGERDLIVGVWCRGGGAPGGAGVRRARPWPPPSPSGSLYCVFRY